jgi:hypothetical protein
LELTAPPGWTLAKAETHRRGEPSGQGDRVEDTTFSAVSIQNTSINQEISIIHTHGDGNGAEAMFALAFLTFIMTEAMLPENRELFARENISSMTVSDPIAVPSVPGGEMFIVTTVSMSSMVSERRVLSMLQVAGDANSRITVATDVPVVGDELFPESVLAIVSTLRFLC